jgi:hypothetical protein
MCEYLLNTLLINLIDVFSAYYAHQTLIIGQIYKQTGIGEGKEVEGVLGEKNLIDFV